MYTNTVSCNTQQHKLASRSWGLHFHGTNHAFDTFSESHIGTGPEANCALGVFTVDNPRVAAGFADMITEKDAGVVLLVLMNETRTVTFDTFEQFLGADADHGQACHDRNHFTGLRGEIGKQYTAGRFAGYDDGVIQVVMNPSDAIIIGAVDCGLARALGKDPVFGTTSDRADPGFKAAVLQRVQELIAERYPFTRAA